MNSDQMNYEITGGQMAVRKRRLQTMHIVFNDAVQRFVVKNDKDGRTFAAGFSTLEEAVSTCKIEDLRRVGLN